MNIDDFEKREQALKFRTKIMQAEEERLSGAKTRSISEARKGLEAFPDSGSQTPGQWLNQKECAEYVQGV